MKTHYEVLGVAEDASVDECKTAWRRLARKYHPDLSNHPRAPAIFKRVKTAWEVVSDPEQRRDYDHQLALARRPKCRLCGEPTPGTELCVLCALAQRREHPEPEPPPPRPVSLHRRPEDYQAVAAGSDALLAALLSEGAIRGAQADADRQLTVRVVVGGDPRFMRSVHRNLSLANRLIRNVQRWLGHDR